MADPTPTPQATPLKISEEVQKKFPDLIELIKASQSMNDEERQYWADVLLVMTEEQIQNLRGILENEKKQMEEANQRLQKGVAEDEAQIKVHFDEIKYKEKKRMLEEAEKKSEDEEKKSEAVLLQEIGKM
jgi:hypothetical protein